MALDHEAIYSAYAGTVVSIDDSAGAFDKDGNSVTIDAVKVAAARKSIDDAPVVDAGACKDTDPEVDPTNFTVML